MSETAYLFIDGGYLRQYFQRTLQSYFGQIDEPLQYLDMARLRAWRNIQRVFYHDCEGPDGENNAFFKKIQYAEGYFLRLGTLKQLEDGTVRQKGVDINIAVGMLHHASRHNFSRAFLLAGDGDFKGLVEELVDIGVQVTILYDRLHIASELREAADHSEAITFSNWYNFTNEIFREKYRIPNYVHHMRTIPDRVATEGYQHHSEISHGGKPGSIWENKEGYMILMPCHSPAGQTLVIKWPDLTQLKKFFEAEFGTLEERP